MAKVTGIGGVFIQSSRDSKALSEWYATHLGLKLEEYGHAILEWKEDVAEDGGLTVWCAAAPDSDWFAPSKASFMINYRVDDMDDMLAQLEAGGVEIVKGPESHENGRFLWVMDPEGNKIELWEPRIWDEKNKAP